MAVGLRFADATRAVDQVARELWAGADYDDVANRKYHAWRKFVQSLGASDGGMPEMVLSHRHLAAMLAADQTVAEIRAAAVESQDELGGFLAPPTVEESILERAAVAAAIRPRANLIIAISDRVTIPRATGGDARSPGSAAVAWIGEQPTQSEAATDLHFGAAHIRVATALMSFTLSRGLWADATMLMGHLERTCAATVAADEDKQALVGPGGVAPLGLLPGGANLHGITEVVSGSVANVTAQGLLNLKFGVAPQYRRGGRGVYILSSALHKAACTMVDGAGRPLVAFDSDRGPFLNGHPIEEVSDGVLPVHTAAGNYAAIFGDPFGCVIAERIGLSVEIKDSSADAAQNRVTCVARRRVGIGPGELYRFAAMKISA